MSSEKLTGWVAWHPHKVLDANLVEIFKTEQMAMDCLCLREGHYDDGDFGAGDIYPEDAIAQGWRIRPVEIVFTDEEEK